jgi:solute carrier family 8 (sodium/calcium exchanger)
MFQVLKCATISRSAFFRHQSDFMWPAINSVWKKQQRTLLTGFKHEKKSLVVAGDGRADSPGHSAKYGCYTLVELTCNKVIDFKLVQVGKHYLVHLQYLGYLPSM